MNTNPLPKKLKIIIPHTLQNTEIQQLLFIFIKKIKK
jgi:hypothetical protein